MKCNTTYKLFPDYESRSTLLDTTVHVLKINAFGHAYGANLFAGRRQGWGHSVERGAQKGSGTTMECRRTNTSRYRPKLKDDDERNL